MIVVKFIEAVFGLNVLSYVQSWQVIYVFSLMKCLCVLQVRWDDVTENLLWIMRGSDASNTAVPRARKFAPAAVVVCLLPDQGREWGPG